MSDRIKIYAAIDGECDYQEDYGKHTSAIDGTPYIPPFKRTTADYLRDITGIAVDLFNQKSSMVSVFRKLAAACVMCMEANGGCARDVNSGAPGPFHEPMLSRKKVYRIIDTERMYQDELDDELPTESGFVIMFKHYLMKAHEQWTIHSGDEYALNIIRQLAGLAVHAMETHGIVLREPFEP